MLSLVETIGSDKPHQFWRKLDFIELTNKNGDLLQFYFFNSGSTRQGDHILAFWQTQKKWIHSEREHLEHMAQRFARHAHVILTTLWLITYRK